jgi:RNA polymerase sigma-70 factor, ECF subfamily
MNRDAQLNDAVEAHQDFVRALALKMVPRPAMAGEIAQQVFLEFLRKRDRWDLTQDLAPLLRAMTQHVARRYWSERKKSMHREAVALIEQIRRMTEHQEPAWYTEEEMAALRECMASLPERSRTLLKMHYDEGLTSVDMAARLQVKPEAVRRALFRIRKRLQKRVVASLSARSRE